MEPLERLKSSTTAGNLWIYILLLGKDREIISDKLPEIIYEKFGFLPNSVLTMAVLFRLKAEGYVTQERFQSQSAFKTAPKGLEELVKAKEYTSALLERFKKAEA
jgi:DNA-binding transcriptional regulator PaaX